MDPFDVFDGAVLVDKPAGLTSHDVVDRIRRRFGIKKVGHCGTLDPGATGLLVIVLGKATRLSEKLMSDDKVYEGSVTFGVTTASYDADGEVKEIKPVPELSVESLNQAAESFIGDLLQTPPMVSAIKKDGVPLYKLARRGIEVERKPKLVHIYNYRFTEYTTPVGKCRVACTKGTYVRSLAHDLGIKLGCGAHLSALRRISTGKFEVTDAVTLEQILSFERAQLQTRVIPYLKLAA